jgi:streptomycin 3"-adenylyltransferase
VDALLDDLDDDTRNVVLTLARAWSTLETGEIRSKDAAAGWALERLPSEHRPVLEHARAIYLGEADERWDRLAADVRPHADYVVGRIRD